MRTDLQILCLAGDLDGGCGFYRIREPARVAQAEGIDITVDTELPVDAYVLSDGSIDIRKMLIEPDIIIFQRPLLDSFVQVIKFAQNRGIACVVEIDDDLKATHPHNVAYEHLNPATSPTSNWEHLMEACDLADLVITSTPNLARRYAAHGRYRICRNYMPESVFDIEVQHSPVAPRLGWSGTIQTHPEDLDVAGPHISAALNNFARNKNFYIVGDGYLVKERLHLKEHNEVIDTGWVPRGDYIGTLAEHIDVGVVPLKIDHFNNSKSWLKMLEMAAVGIPSVGSPTEENIALAEILGNKTAKKPKDWQRHLKPLLSDPAHYLERSEAVREAARPLTYENHIGDWVEAWNQALENRSNASRKFFANA
jgi:glycosyltransferase involved in cell wall biosynthesis